jgi:hypothetical protein
MVKDDAEMVPGETGGVCTVQTSKNYAHGDLVTLRHHEKSVMKPLTSHRYSSIRTRSPITQRAPSTSTRSS